MCSSNGERLMIKLKYKRKNSNFIIQYDSVLHLKEGSLRIEGKYASMLTVIITRFEDNSDLLIFFFILYIFSNFYSLYIILLSIFKRRKKVFGTRYSCVILGKLVITMMMTTLY